MDLPRQNRKRRARAAERASSCVCPSLQEMNYYKDSSSKTSHDLPKVGQNEHWGGNDICKVGSVLLLEFKVDFFFYVDRRQRSSDCALFFMALDLKHKGNEGISSLPQKPHLCKTCFSICIVIFCFHMVLCVGISKEYAYCVICLLNRYIETENIVKFMIHNVL